MFEVGEEEPDSMTKTIADGGIFAPRKVVRCIPHRIRRAWTAKWTACCRRGTGDLWDSVAPFWFGKGGAHGAKSKNDEGRGGVYPGLGR